jgi:hypothetical protein
LWTSRIKDANERKPVKDDNLFLWGERVMSNLIVEGLDQYRIARDNACELMFQAIYESPWMRVLSDFGGAFETQDNKELEELRRLDAIRWRKYMTEGEFPDAVIRIFLAVGFADQVVRRKGYQVMRRLFAASPSMKGLDPDDLRQIVREQSRIVQTDADQAIDTLPHLLPSSKDRKDALDMIEKAVKNIGRTLAAQEQAVIQRIKTVLQG